MQTDATSVDSECAALLSREQAARHLGISTRNLDYLREAGKLPFIQIGRRVVFAPLDLENFIEARRVATTNNNPRLLAAEPERARNGFQ